MELYRWYIQVYCWLRGNDDSDEDFVELRKRCTTTGNANKKKVLFEKRIKPMFDMLTKVFFVKQSVMILWSGVIVFIDSDRATSADPKTDIVHKHYLAYNFTKLSFAYLLTTVLGHLFRQWRRSAYEKKVEVQAVGPGDMETKDASINLVEDRDDDAERFPQTKCMKEWAGDSSFYNYAFLAMITEVKDKCGVGPLAEDYFYKASMVFFIQFSMVLVLVQFEASTASGNVAQPSLQAMFLKLFTAYLFHMMNYTDLDSAYRRFKFLRYNAKKFDPETLWCAFMTTQYQFWVAVVCEIGSIFYITKQATYINIIVNYLSFKGITILDDMFAASQRRLKIRDALGDEKYADVFDEALTFERQPKDGSANTIANPHHKDSFLDKLVNAFMIFVFTIERLFYKSIYFYVLPYFVVFLTYYLLIFQTAA